MAYCESGKAPVIPLSHFPGKAVSHKGQRVCCFSTSIALLLPLCVGATNTLLLLWGQVQSFKSRVLFREACAAIPEDALLLEVGPHAILRSPLRQVGAHTALQPPYWARGC